jgi:2-polyprenyl-3-methyl-5-hydroxy-6-metoxy-1,4-benzoquinol methylase
MKKPNAVRGSSPLDNFLAKLRHGVAHRYLKRFQPINSCLDIGSGNYPIFLIKLHAKGKHGLEKSVSQEIRQVADQNQISMTEYDLESRSPLPFDDGSFEVVTMIAVIEHIQPENVSFLLREIHRILKDDGALFVTTPAAWTDIILKTMAKFGIIAKEEIDDHKDTFTRAKLRNYFVDAGFPDTQTESGTFECFMNLWCSSQKKV